MASSITAVERSGKTDNCIRDRRRERMGHANYGRVVGNLRGSTEKNDKRSELREVCSGRAGHGEAKFQERV